MVVGVVDEASSESLLPPKVPPEQLQEHPGSDRGWKPGAEVVVSRIGSLAVVGIVVVERIVCGVMGHLGGITATGVVVDAVSKLFSFIYSRGLMNCPLQRTPHTTLHRFHFCFCWCHNYVILLLLLLLLLPLFRSRFHQ